MRIREFGCGFDFYIFYAALDLDADPAPVIYLSGIAESENNNAAMYLMRRKLRYFSFLFYIFSTDRLTVLKITSHTVYHIF
jgi:hypothetical protein